MADIDTVRKIRNIALITAIISGIIFFIIAFMAISEEEPSLEKYRVPLIIFGGIAFLSGSLFATVWRITLKTRVVKAVATA